MHMYLVVMKYIVSTPDLAQHLAVGYADPATHEAHLPTHHHVCDMVL
jgi:hypothetical protein